MTRRKTSHSRCTQRSFGPAVGRGRGCRGEGMKAGRPGDSPMRSSEAAGGKRMVYPRTAPSERGTSLS